MIVNLKSLVINVFIEGTFRCTSGISKLTKCEKNVSPKILLP